MKNTQTRLFLRGRCMIYLLIFCFDQSAPAVAQWLRFGTRSLKVAGSNPAHRFLFGNYFFSENLFSIDNNFLVCSKRTRRGSMSKTREHNTNHKL